MRTGLRILGWLLLFGGCLAMASLYIDVSRYTYMTAFSYTKVEPAPLDAPTIPQDVALHTIWDFAGKMNTFVRTGVFWPTIAMFVGGVILGLSGNARRAEKGHAG